MAEKIVAGPIVECVPNFSEGRDRGKVEAIVRAMRVEGVHLLDYSLDADHNRSVVTIAGAPEAVVESAVRGAGAAAKLIDLTRQQGEHPRIGAADVVPFVPVSGVSLVQCVMLARQAGMEIWNRFGVPVYFYEAAAARPDRVNLEDVRRGQFEGLVRDASRDTARRPDVGGPEPHSTAGASAVGARTFLIAYNIYLAGAGVPQVRVGAAARIAAAVRAAAGLQGKSRKDGQQIISSPEIADVGLARTIAKEVRASSGGMLGVKAMGLLVNGRPQVSMNITDFQKTPVAKIHAAVEQIAARHGAQIGDGELIGLIPEAAYEPDADWIRQIPGFDPEEKVVERRLRHPMEWP